MKGLGKSIFITLILVLFLMLMGLSLRQVSDVGLIIGTIGVAIACWIKHKQKKKLKD